MRGIKENGMQIFAIIFISIMAIMCIMQNNWIGFVIEILLILSNVALIICNVKRRKRMAEIKNQYEKTFLKNL